MEIVGDSEKNLTGRVLINNFRKPKINEKLDLKKINFERTAILRKTKRDRGATKTGQERKIDPSHST